jgi:hypothetical protein
MSDTKKLSTAYREANNALHEARKARFRVPMNADRQVKEAADRNLAQARAAARRADAALNQARRRRSA